MTLSSVGMARSSILRRFHSLAFPHRFSLIRAGILEIIGTTDKVHPPYRSNKDAGAIACSICWFCRPVQSPISVRRSWTKAAGKL
jgi:hypothetical protein